MHCAMRTFESCMKQMLLIMSTAYVANKGGDKATIDTHLNEVVSKQLGVRRLISTNEKGELNKFQANGQEVRTYMKDLQRDEEEGGSELLKAVTETYAKLHKPASERDTKLGEWRVVLMHWALAMTAAYVMRAGEEERRTFRKHVKFYVMKKSCIRAGITVWYDWQLFAHMTRIFYTFGSLYAICQEGMEACQKRANMLLRLSSNFAAVGRIPLRVVRDGRDAVVAYLKARRANLKTPEAFLWLKSLTSFYGEFYDSFQAVRKYKAEGRVCDWKETFVPAWEYFVAMSYVYRIIAAKRSWDKATHFRRARTVQWSRAEDGRTFRVQVFDAHRLQLVEEMREYYAPTEAEEDLLDADELDEKGLRDRRRTIQRERRKRWAQRARHPELWRAVEYTANAE
jgi:hypothetical protein